MRSIIWFPLILSASGCRAWNPETPEWQIHLMGSLIGRFEHDDIEERGRAASEAVDLWDVWTHDALNLLVHAAETGASIEVRYLADRSAKRIRLRRFLKRVDPERVLDLERLILGPPGTTRLETVRAVWEYAGRQQDGPEAGLCLFELVVESGCSSEEKWYLLEAMPPDRRFAHVAASFLDDPDLDIRGFAAGCLGLMGAREYAPLVAAQLGSPDVDVVCNALRGLADLGARAWIPRIREYLRARDPSMRIAAETALRLLGERVPSSIPPPRVEK